jgi:TRAP-type mannitol/chloroaromatic compound transport system substrate-binding protein
MSNNIFQLLIKPKSWKELPDDLKAIVEKAAMAATLQGYASFWQDTIEADKKITAYGIVATKLSKADQDKTREITMQILDEKSAQDPFFKKVWESQKKFIKEFRPYFDLTKFD